MIHADNGGTVVTGKSITTFQYLALASALGLEAKGLKHSKGSVLKKVKAITGLKTNDRMVQAARIRLLAHFNETGPLKCPKCGKQCVVPLPVEEVTKKRNVDTKTNVVCLPTMGGCDNGFELMRASSL
jgi:hypothetical protein